MDNLPHSRDHFTPKTPIFHYKKDYKAHSLDTSRIPAKLPNYNAIKGQLFSLIPQKYIRKLRLSKNITKPLNIGEKEKKDNTKPNLDVQGFFATWKKKPLMPILICAFAAIAVLYNINAKATNLLQADESSVVFNYLVGLNFKNETVKAKDPRALVNKRSEDLASVSVAMADNAALNSETVIASTIVSDNALTEAAAIPKEVAEVDNAYKGRGELVVHSVKEGETLSSIARLYGLSAETLLAEARWPENDIITPGTKINIPPADAPIITVPKGKTLSEIAKNYYAQDNLEEIIARNGLPEDGTLKEGQTIIVYGGDLPEKPKPKPEPAPTRITKTKRARQTRRIAIARRDSSSTRGTAYTASEGHAIPYGWCTYGAAQIWKNEYGQSVNWGGNAGTWLNGASSAGYNTGQTPQEGALFVSNESSYGHTGVVRKVNSDGSIEVEEMNYQGFGKYNTRKLQVNDPRLKGFVYPK